MEERKKRKNRIEPTFATLHIALNANELHEKRMEKEFKIQIERWKHGHG